jgi:hypothetical protein
MKLTHLVRESLLAAALLLIASQAIAQRPASEVEDNSLGTPTGHDLAITVSKYTYEEPDAPGISIHGPKFGGEYTGAWSLNRRQRWFVQANVQGLMGSATYDGACAPWFIRPNSASPNGYELDLGGYSPCSETGDADWYAEARGFVGKDIIGQRWAWSPSTGVGLRHLSNGTTGTDGYRTDEYLYVPFGLTARTKVASDRVLSFTVEYDRLIHGWQKTRNSALGGGFVPATPTAPAFTIDGFTDISFSQQSGWALRASATYHVTRRVTVAPYYLHWSVNASAVNTGTVTFTVNNVTAREQLGAYEPFNVTNEFGVKFGVHF